MEESPAVMSTKASIFDRLLFLRADSSLAALLLITTTLSSSVKISSLQVE
jgi:hypothetical protein